MKERIVGFILYPFSFLFFRNRKKWVFGSYGGFNDNSKYLFLYVIENHPEINAIWIYEKKHAHHFLNVPFKAYPQWSLWGLYHCLTAKVYIYSAYPKEINFFTSGGAILFNLWHGIGIKKIEFLIDSGPLKDIFKLSLKNIWKYPWLFRKPDFVLSTSPFTSENFFSPAFRIKKNRCVELGYPRCDIFFLPHDNIMAHILKTEPKETLYLIEEIKKHKEVYIYLPTWRDTIKDFLVESDFDFEKLNEVLSKKNSLFLIKVHVNTNFKTGINSKLSNIIFIPSNLDIYPILPFTTCLITDYSSIYFDYLLLNKRIILFPFDYEQYIEKNRGLIFNYNDTMVSEKVYNFEDLLIRIGSLDEKNNYTKDNQQLEKFWDGYKGSASADCTKFLKEILCIK